MFIARWALDQRSDNCIQAAIEALHALLYSGKLQVCSVVNITAVFQSFYSRCSCKLLSSQPKQQIQGVHTVSTIKKKLLPRETMRYCNEGCFMLISIS